MVPRNRYLYILYPCYVRIYGYFMPESMFCSARDATLKKSYQVSPCPHIKLPVVH